MSFYLQAGLVPELFYGEFHDMLTLKIGKKYLFASEISSIFYEFLRLYFMLDSHGRDYLAKSLLLKTDYTCSYKDKYLPIYII